MLAGQTTLIFNLCMDGHREVVAKRALRLENVSIITNEVGTHHCSIDFILMCKVVVVQQRMRGLLKTAMGKGNDCVWMGLDWQDAATLQVIKFCIFRLDRTNLPVNNRDESDSFRRRVQPCRAAELFSKMGMRKKCRPEDAFIT